MLSYKLVFQVLRLVISSTTKYGPLDSFNLHECLDDAQSSLNKARTELGNPGNRLSEL